MFLLHLPWEEWGRLRSGAADQSEPTSFPASKTPSPSPLKLTAFLSQQNLESIQFHLLPFRKEKSEVSEEERAHPESQS